MGKEGRREGGGKHGEGEERRGRREEGGRAGDIEGGQEREERRMVK